MRVHSFFTDMKPFRMCPSSRTTWLLLVLLHLQAVSSSLQSSTSTAWIGNLFSAASKSPSPQQQQQQKRQKPQQQQLLLDKDNTCNPLKVRIRTTRPEEITNIAELLSHASIQPSTEQNHFRFHVDRLFAKKDIESLLKRRNQVIETGRKLVKRIAQDYNGSSTAWSTADYLKVLWNGGGALSEQFKSLLEKAAHETAEPNVWQQHIPFALTPAHIWWFQHLQLTAVSVLDDRPPASNNLLSTNQQGRTVIGFCEVAMLANPMYNSEKNSKSNIEKPREGNGQDLSTTNGFGNQGKANGDNQFINGNQNKLNNSIECQSDAAADNDAPRAMTKTLSQQEYIPAILNLATATSWRRQGIACRLVRSAEQYVRLYWKDETLMGLFVQVDNHAAQALYQKLGYQRVIICDGGSQLGDMWYMIQDLKKQKYATTEKLTDAKQTIVDSEDNKDEVDAATAVSEQTLFLKER